MSCYLTYTEEFQQMIIEAKNAIIPVKDICKQFNISVYTLYKILHMNGEMPIPSQVSEGKGSEKGVEHRGVSPNNNPRHEHPASTWKNYGERHKKIEHVCLRCGNIFYARDRGNRTKFCSPLCKSKYQTEQNSVINICDNCGQSYRVKSSQTIHYIHCSECREKNLGRVSSKMSRQIHSWLKEVFKVEDEKTFSWFYDSNKPKGRFRLDFFLPKYNLGIEYDGEQHFRPTFTSRWESVKDIQMRDKLKEVLCIKNGIKIIRFKYDESITKKSMLMKIYAELQGNELVEVEDKKPLR
jgi:very-short-patch-repair endonuclease/DNA-directed RNA polymerase subunit RPC12/RpoP